MEQPQLGDATPASETRHLRSVDPETGEYTDHGGSCPGCIRRDREIEGLETEKRGWRTRYQNLARDKEKEGKAHELWPEAVKLFDFWKERTNHRRSEWNAERFWLCVPYLQKDGVEPCRLAIEGIAYDPNTKIAKNGHLERFDSWELLFRNRATFERYCNRAPHHLPKPEHVRTLADALMHVWKWEPAQAVAEAQRRLR